MTVIFAGHEINVVDNGTSRCIPYATWGDAIIKITGGSCNDTIVVNTTKGFDDGSNVIVEPTAGNDHVYIATATIPVTAIAGCGTDYMSAGFNKFYTNICQQVGVTFIGGSGFDTFVGSAGDDCITTGTGPCIIYEGDGANNINVPRTDTAAVDIYLLGCTDATAGTCIQGNAGVGHGYERILTSGGKLPYGVCFSKINIVESTTVTTPP